MSSLAQLNLHDNKSSHQDIDRGANFSDKATQRHWDRSSME